MSFWLTWLFFVSFQLLFGFISEVDSLIVSYKDVHFADFGYQL